MAEENPSPEPDQKRQQDESLIDPKNPFHLMREMMRQSVGKIPAGLVIIFAVALSLSLVTGAVMQYVSVLQQEAGKGTHLIPSPGKSLNESTLQGGWASAHDVSYGGFQKSYAMSFVVMKDRFEWILEDRKTPRIRYFMRGNLSLEGDVLKLTQRENMGYPGDTQNPTIRYMPLPMDTLEMWVFISGGKMVWSVPRSEYSQISSPLLRLFNDTEKTDVVWGRYRFNSD